MIEEFAAPSGEPLVPHEGQRRLLELTARVRVAVCGRRFGKTWTAEYAVIQKVQQAKQALRIWWIAPVNAQAAAVEREVALWANAGPPTRKIHRRDAENAEEGKGGTDDCGLGIADCGLDGNSNLTPGPSPERRGEKTENPSPGTRAARSCPPSPTRGEGKPLWEHHKSSHTLVYVPNGSRIEFHSAHVPDRLRGAGLDLVVVDEAADVSEYTWTHVIRPMLLDRQGEAFILGTPRGTRNWLHRVFLMGQSSEHEGRYASVQLPTSSNNRILADELEQYRKEMKPDEFAQECEAKFVDGVGAVFTNVPACVNGEALSRGRKGETYITGIDLGEHKDFTALCSVGVRAERCDGFARFQNIGWAAQVERILAHLQLFPGPCVVDRSGVGDPIFQDLRARHEGLVVPFIFSPQSKEEIVRGLAMALETKTLELANVPDLIGELQAFQYEDDGRHGGMLCRKYGAPAGLHDDCVIALALAWAGLKKGLWGGVEGNPMRERGFYG
jgi:predicted GNAT family acetyltransferase